MQVTQEFQGCLYDIVEELVVERSAALRRTYAEAMDDAKALAVANDDAESFDDSGDGNATVGRVDESYCFVMINGYIAYSPAEAA